MLMKVLTLLNLFFELYEENYPFNKQQNPLINLISQTKQNNSISTKIMNTRQSWLSTLKSQQQQTLMNSFISTVSFQNINDKDYISQSLSQIDKRLSSQHAHEYYDPKVMSQQVEPRLLYKKKLSLPKHNSLTDSMIRHSLGFDQKYAKSYNELLQSTKEEAEKQNRIDKIKKKFSQSNSFVDVCANIKPHQRNPFQPTFRPVIDNQHQAYLKTQLIFLQKPNNPKITEKQYFDKHIDQVASKIEQLGGMEDVLGKMQSSLSENEMKSFKKKQFLEEVTSSPRKNPFYIPSPKKLQKMSSSQIAQKTWLDRSRLMRQSFKNKFHIK